MACERYEPELIEAAVGMPASPDLARHLAECLGCRSRLEAERRLMEDTDRSLRDALRVEPSPGFEGRLLVATRRASRSASRSSWLPLWTPALAAGLGFLLAFGWLARPSQRPTSAPRRVVATTAAPAPPPHTSAPLVGPPRTAPAPSRREPEVLVPAGREQALVAFVALLRDPRVEPPKLLIDATRPESPLPEIEPIEILDLEQKAPSNTVEPEGRSQS